MNSIHTRPDIPVIFEDEHLLIIDKPVHILSQKDHTSDPDVLTLCKEYLQKTGKTVPYLGLVHRLDRPVGGLMMLAKSRKAARSLSEQIHDNRIQKTYWAVVSGEVPANGMLVHYLKKNPETNVVRTIPANRKDAKKAELSFIRLESRHSLHLLEIHLQTGRPHQIRVQLAEEGYPVWGDYKYGKGKREGKDIALRAVKLFFEHPLSGKDMRFESLPPETAPWNSFKKFI